MQILAQRKTYFLQQESVLADDLFGLFSDEGLVGGTLDRLLLVGLLIKVEVSSVLLLTLVWVMALTEQQRKGCFVWMRHSSLHQLNLRAGFVVCKLRRCE